MSQVNKVVKQTMTIKCPECLNFMNVTIHKNGNQSGRCPVCKAKIFSKQHSETEKLIRIIKQS